MGEWSQDGLVTIAPAIYLLDDDPSVLRSLDRLLTAEGYAVRAFATVVEFMQIATRQPAALAVLDYIMPGLSGLYVQACLSRSSAATRIIMISASQDAAVRAHALRTGAYAFINKPFDEETFLSAVRGALSEPPHHKSIP